MNLRSIYELTTMPEGYWTDSTANKMYSDWLEANLDTAITLLLQCENEFKDVTSNGNSIQNIRKFITTILYEGRK